MTPLIDPARIATLLRETAEAEIMPRFRQLESHEITEKNPGDLVTVADQAAETFLTKRLADLIPNALIIGEEAHESQPAALAALGNAEWAWIIDPLDEPTTSPMARPGSRSSWPWRIGAKPSWDGYMIR